MIEKNYSQGEAQLGLKEQISIQYKDEKKLDESATKLNVLSLFSGCGGMDLGFEGGFLTHRLSVAENNFSDFVDEIIDKNYVKLKPTKFKTIFSNDILKDARNAWVNHFSKKNHFEGTYRTESIVNLVKLHESGEDVFPKKIHVVTGGFPCQDFSVAGKRNGFESHKNHHGRALTINDNSEETRGKLYYWMKRVIEITEPDIFIAENVKGLVNLSNVKEIIQNDFASANGNGYIVFDPQVLNSADYGVSQSRQRVFFIGVKKSSLNKKALKELSKKKHDLLYNPYPKQTHSKEGYVKLKDIFTSLKEPEDSKDLSQKFYSKAKYMGKHCQGQTEINLEGIGPTIRAEHHGNIEYRRLSEKNGGKILKEIKKGKKERRLTVRECALIQSFPPDYQFVIESKNTSKKFLLSPSQAYKIIGNAVPPLLAYNLARHIESLWDTYFKD